MTILMGLFGWISYRFRETRAMSCGQFLEMRYSRGVRRLAAILRGTADALANCIGPAVAVRFLIYLLGIPHRFAFLGHTIPTFPFMLAACLCLALLMILCGGRISLLVTDAIQGLVSYPIFVIMCVYIFTQFSWTNEISAVMADRVPHESFMNPFVIMFSLPFAAVGVILGLWATGTALSVMGMVGILILVGIVVKNGIVLIDYTILCRERGMSVLDASVTAARSRLRPILMTTLTTVLGMLPMALGRGDGAELWNGLGMVVCWGLTVSTLVTLVLIPAVYCVFATRQEKRASNKYEII
jgi:hypothetical protein